MYLLADLFRSTFSVRKIVWVVVSKISLYFKLQGGFENKLNFMETEILKLELPIKNKCMPVVIILIITLLYWTNNIKLRMEIF